MRRLMLLLVAAVALTACPLLHFPNASTGTITITFVSAAGSGSRTVVPDLAIQLDEIEVDLASNDGYAAPAPAFCNGEPWQVTVSDIPVGSWNVHAIARKGGVQVAAADANGITLSTGAALQVPLALTVGAAGPTGSVQFTVRFPHDLGIDYVEGTIEETANTSVPTLSDAGTSLSGTFSFALPPGTYSLVMTFRRGGPAGASAGIFREKVVVVGGFQSSGWVNASGGLDSERVFAATDFLEGDASLSGLVVSGTFTTGFSSSIYSYVGNPIPDATVTFTATGFIDGQYIQYGWDGAALTEIRSGLPSPDHVTGATNTLQVRVTAPDRQTTRDYTVTFVHGYVVGTVYSTPCSGGSINFEVDASGNVIIDSATAGVTDLVIPSSIDGHAVTAIAEFSFDYATLTSVVIPDSVTTIGRSAFEGCYNLTSIVFPSSLASLGPNACRDCVSLVSVSLPPGVDVPDGGFMYCSALSSLTIPEGLTYIGSNSFTGSSLTSVSIPASVTILAWSAFGYCSALQTVNIYATTPPILDSVNAPPFDGDFALTAIYVPAASVTAYKSAPVWVDNYVPLIQAGTW